jgi:hypothetical protein
LAGTPRAEHSTERPPHDIGVPMKKAILASLGVLLLIALTACGSGKSGDKDKISLSKDEKTAAANLQKVFTESSSDGLTTTEAKCVATHFVDSVGLTKLKSTKLLTDTYEVDTTASPTFDADTAGKFADSLLGCVNYQKQLAEQTAKTDTTIDETKFEDCLEEKLPDSLVKKMLVAAQTNSSDATDIGTQGQKALTDCKTTAKK